MTRHNELVDRLDEKHRATFDMYANRPRSELRAQLVDTYAHTHFPNPEPVDYQVRVLRSALLVHMIDVADGYRELVDRLQDRAPSNGVDTSDEAAAKTYKRLTKLRLTVLAEIARLGVACSDDVEQSTGMKHQTVSTRFMELRRGGYIEFDSDTVTAAGNRAKAYRLTTDGRSALAEIAGDQ